MGQHGPVGKRDEERRRRNKPDVATKTGGGPVGSPELGGEHSELAVVFWVSLGESGQSEWFQPSDWAAARLVVVAIDSFVKRPSAVMLATIQSMMGSLLVTEGDRRRLRVELEQVEPAAPVSVLDDYRDSLAG